MNDNNERALEMSAYIWRILRAQPIVFLAWGLTPDKISPVTKDRMVGASFTVHGIRHQGPVDVLYDEGDDLFVVRLLDSEGKAILTQPEVYIGNLVSTIDALVEGY